ncbi:hypothetical protein BC828DRAFT_391314 [Blastocladiella britannica]|nr:hypothetical protein BC828DRAFT_391314 [Blastocladiella britannica]
MDSTTTTATTTTSAAAPDMRFYASMAAHYMPPRTSQTDDLAAMLTAVSFAPRPTPQPEVHPAPWTAVQQYSASTSPPPPTHFRGTSASTTHALSTSMAELALNDGNNAMDMDTTDGDPAAKQQHQQHYYSAASSSMVGRFAGVNLGDDATRPRLGHQSVPPPVALAAAIRASPPSPPPAYPDMHYAPVYHHQGTAGFGAGGGNSHHNPAQQAAAAMPYIH